MAKLIRFERAKAHERLRQAELVLKQARELLNANSGSRGLGINIAVVNKVRSAEKRVAEARAALKKVDPSYIE